MSLHKHQAPAAFTGNVLSSDYLAFRLGDDRYGIEMRTVREIRPMEPVTRLVQVPRHVRGVIEVRGEIIVVTDLRARFGMQAPETASQSVVIVINLANAVGMLVDGVTDVVALRATDIQPPPALEGDIDERFVKGIASTQGGMLIVLDVVPLLTRPAPGETLQ